MTNNNTPSKRDEKVLVPYSLALFSQKLFTVGPRIKKFDASWNSSNGLRYVCTAPVSLHARDLRTLLSILYILQNHKKFQLELEPYNDDRYKVWLPMRTVYSFLSLPKGGSYRSNLNESLTAILCTRLTVSGSAGKRTIDEQPVGFGLNTGGLAVHSLQRSAPKYELLPLKSLINVPRTNALTESIGRIKNYESDCARLIDYHVTARKNRGISATISQWRDILTNGYRIDRFRAKFIEAYQELESGGHFDIFTDDEDKITIRTKPRKR